MKKLVLFILSLSILALDGMAENSFVYVEYQNFHFTNSVQKDKGKRYTTHIAYKYKKSFYEAAYSKNHTKTYQPPMKDDLYVDKYYCKYSYAFDQKQSFSLSYATLNDNLTKETDGGNIYGLSYRYKAVKVTQYISDYKNFNVYQSNLQYTLKKDYNNVEYFFTLLGMYIDLDNKDSNKYTTKADTNYLTSSLMMKVAYNGYYSALGAYIGKRIFAVMNDGFSVQNRAMEFDRTYNVVIGKRFSQLDIMLKYLYMRATEVPVDNEDVVVKSIIAGIKYRF